MLKLNVLDYQAVIMRDYYKSIFWNWRWYNIKWKSKTLARGISDYIEQRGPAYLINTHRYTDFKFQHECTCDTRWASHTLGCIYDYIIKDNIAKSIKYPPNIENMKAILENNKMLRYKNEPFYLSNAFSIVSSHF